jgi:hypothetical protein
MTAGLVLATIPTALWIFSDAGAITWKESEVNSTARRALIREAAEFVAPRYESGEGVFFSSFGELAAVLREAGIPLREGLHDGNGPAWLGAVMRPDLLLHERWALAFSGDEVPIALKKVEDRPDPYNPGYHLLKRIEIKDHQPLEIYHHR